MMEMIPFYLLFTNVAGFPQTPFSTYILSETINYVGLYIIFRANRIISSATRHHSYISLASTNNIWGIKMTLYMFLAPREYLHVIFARGRYSIKRKKETSHRHIFPCNLYKKKKKKCEYHSM